MKYKAIYLLAFSLLLSLSACKFQKIVKKGTVDEKYEAAVKLYNQKDYSRALQLFDQVTGIMRATDKAQKIAYYYAYCYYNQKDYTLASYYFKRYSTTYPNTEEAEECLFMSAYCNYLSSPEFTLDQTVTYEALKDLQLFVNTYPTSKRVSECNDLIDKLRLKLEMKDYRIAKLYYRMYDYTASITMLNNILKDFPDTPHKEEILFLILKSYHKFAQQSITGKQKERYTKAITAYAEFITQFPNSKFLAEANGLKEKSRSELESFNKPEKKKKQKNTEIQ
ncbi:MAG: outer membrane protein assembly factor BamD [Bacteroidales bacterium]|nr:outer membrane protein assembly factor BamD [Bacteroidales bacterium]